MLVHTTTIPPAHTLLIVLWGQEESGRKWHKGRGRKLGRHRVSGTLQEYRTLSHQTSSRPTTANSRAGSDGLYLSPVRQGAQQKVFLKAPLNPVLTCHRTACTVCGCGNLPQSLKHDVNHMYVPMYTYPTAEVSHKTWLC